MTVKYRVQRVDGTDAPGGRHDGCQYLVLDLTHDEDARFAAVAYASERLVHGSAETSEEDREWLLLLIDQIRGLPPISRRGAPGQTRRSGPSSPG